MDTENKKAHWSTAYLKRINSTEVSIKREDKNKRKRNSKIQRIETVPEFIKTEDTSTKTPRTPDRVLHTPVRKSRYITPHRRMSIPQTPNAQGVETSYMTKSKKRLFW